MASFRHFHRSFVGGELSPEMFGRFEDVKFQTGVARLRNFVNKPAGPARTRPPFLFVREGRDPSKEFRELPFIYSSTQSLIVEAGAGYFRFHIEGETVLTGTVAAYVPDHALSAVGAPEIAGDYFTVAGGHGLLTGDPINFTTSGTLPVTVPQIVAGVTYYAKEVVGQPTRFQVTEVVGGAVIDITGNFVTDTVVHRVYSFRDLVSYGTTDPGVYYYKVTTPTGGHVPTETAFWYRMQPELNKSATFLPANVDIANDIITLNRAHGLSNGSPIEFWNQDGELPGPLLEGVTYYARDVTEFSFKVAATNTPGAALNLTNLGITNTGVHRVRFGWTNDFIYEIPNTFIEDNLRLLDYAQSADVLTITHADFNQQELRRYGPTSWSFLTSAFGSTVSAPASVTATATNRGQGLRIKTLYTNTGAGMELESKPTLAIEDPVFIYGVQGAIGGDGLDGFYNVLDLNIGAAPYQVTVKHMTTGIAVTLANEANYTDNSGILQYAPLSTSTSNTYAVTAIDANGVESSAAFSSACVNNLFATGAYNTITWPAVTGASEYRVYKLQRGLYGFIGSTQALTFKDGGEDTSGGIAPDMSISPPTQDTTLVKPAKVGYYQQRKVFAAPDAFKQSVWMTRPGTESDLGYHIPLRDDDRIAFTIPGTQEIRHILALQHLVLLTSENEIQVTPVNTDALTPTSVDARPHTYTGSNTVKPLIVNNNAIFCGARGGHVYELGFQIGGGLVVGDLCTRALHLFDQFQILDATQSKAPWPIMWFISTAGNLLGLTYMPQEQIGGWHRHDTVNGTFVTCCAIPEGDEDRLYVGVARNSGGFTVHNIERMAPMAIDKDDTATWFGSDSGVLYEGSPANLISGLDHLEGQTVNILADGLVVAPQVVVNGTITLAKLASIVHVGLPMTCQLQTMPFSAQIDGLGSGRMENVAKVWLRVVNAGKFKVGPTESKLRPAFFETGLVGTEDSRVIDVNIDGKWGPDGQVFVQQTDPLPLTVVSMTLAVTLS